MYEIEIGKPYSFRCGGEELAKVLTYYGFVSTFRSEDKIVCPFHKDVNPSMKIDLIEGSFYCYGCNLSGDAYTFVQMINPHLNDIEVAVKLFKILKSNRVRKIMLPKWRREPKEFKDDYDKACDYYYNLSSVDWEESVLSEAVHVRKYMYGRGFDPETLNKCGAKITYNKSYMAIFPMFDNDTFKGWVCRTTLPEIEKKRKYLYNKGFSRLTTLVGNYLNQSCVFVVEGYMDRLKFVQYGVENVVAILGWKMGREQEEKLKKAGVKCVVSALDNDVCGRKGTKYLRSIFPNVVRFCYLKGIKDVGETDFKTFNKMYKKTMKEVEKNDKSGSS